VYGVGRLEGIPQWRGGRGGGLVVLLLAERAASEGPRSTRAVEDNRRPSPREKKTSELGRII
jgi:hypothetical protein